MIISIHQPDYIPYIGYFYKIAQSDVFVFLDDVQFSNDNMHNWNKIKTPQGEFRLKVPVEYQFGDKINEVRTRDELKWKEKHLKTIEMSYSRSQYFKEIYPHFSEVLLANYRNLADMNIEINKFICRGFGIRPRFIKSSDIDVQTIREERVIDICKALGGSKYISGNGARAYQIDENFISRGIELEYTDYKSFEYKQPWKDFISNLSVIDFIFNCGFDFEFVRKSLRGE